METDGPPVIDMQNHEGLADEIVKASEEYGCFRMVNHGVPADLMAEMRALTPSLFKPSLYDLPEDIKRRTLHSQHRNGGIQLNLAGYEGLTLDVTSFSDDFCDRLDPSPYQREIMNKYVKAICDLAEFLGRKIMEGNGLAGDLFDGWCCHLRINKYYFCPAMVGLTGVEIHSDPTFFTIAQDDFTGPQFIDKSSGEFVPFDPIPGTLAVNVGDIAKVWSNGRYCNVKHRVWCFEPNPRYSISLFVVGPNGEKIEAPSKLVDEEHPRLYAPIDVHEYRNVRLSRDLHTGGALELYRITT